MNGNESPSQHALNLPQISPREKMISIQPEEEKQDDDYFISLSQIPEIATNTPQAKPEANLQKTSLTQLESKHIDGKDQNTPQLNHPALMVNGIQGTRRWEGEEDFLLNNNTFSNRNNELYSGLPKPEKTNILESPLGQNSSPIKDISSQHLKAIRTIENQPGQGQETGNMAHRESQAGGNRSISMRNGNVNLRRPVEESKFQESSYVPQQGSNLTEEHNEQHVNVPANVLDLEVIVEGENNAENRQMITEMLHTEENYGVMNSRRPLAAPQSQNQNQNQNQAQVQAINPTSPATAVNSPEVPNSNYRPLTAAELHRIKEPETKMHLNHLIGFFFAVILCSIMVLVHINEKDFFNLIFLITLFYLGYYLLLEAFGTLKLLGDIWIRGDEFYYALDAASAALAVIIIFLKTSNYLPYCSFACVPFAMVTLIYMIKSEAHPNKKSGNIFVRLYYILQILLITLRLESSISWDWSLIMALSGIFLGGFTAGSIAVYLTLFSKVVNSRRIQNRSYIYNLFVKFLGLVWHFVYYCISALGLLTLFIATAAFTNDASEGGDDDFSLLKFFAKIDLGVGIFVVVIGITARKPLVDFMIYYGIVESHLARVERRKRRRQPRALNFETEQKPSYFVMLSSTFFKPLSSSISSRGTQGLEKLKEMIQKVKLGVNKRITLENTITSEERLKTDQDLRQQKEILDKKVIKMNNNRTPIKKNIKKEDAQEVINMTFDIDINQKDFIESDDRQNNNIHLALSVDNMKNIEEFHKDDSPIRASDDEGLCHLCCTNLPNAILMNCGHGGICYDCAVALVNRKDECLECRLKIDAIYKIDPNPKALNIVKGLELNKIIKHTTT